MAHTCSTVSIHTSEEFARQRTARGRTVSAMQLGFIPLGIVVLAVKCVIRLLKGGER